MGKSLSGGGAWRVNTRGQLVPLTPLQLREYLAFMCAKSMRELRRRFRRRRRLDWMRRPSTKHIVEVTCVVWQRDDEKEGPQMEKEVSDSNEDDNSDEDDDESTVTSCEEQPIRRGLNCWFYWPGKPPKTQRTLNEFFKKG